MGQALWRSLPNPPQLEDIDVDYDAFDDDDDEVETFPDLSHLPPELAISVLSHLNATDLCLAACVWQKLASDQILWQGLCQRQWPKASIYARNANDVHYKKVYLLLDEGTLTFNSDPVKGMKYFFERGLVKNEPKEIANFFHATEKLSKSQMRLYLETRGDVVDAMMRLQNYDGQFLPNALRKCFAKLEAPPNDRGAYLQELLAAFSERFVECNPKLGYNIDAVYVMCFSLILLSVDLTSPHVKNKMTKREFIRNTRHAVDGSVNDDDVLGELYDNVFLRGHVSCSDEDVVDDNKRNKQFVPGYLAMFM